MNMPTDDELRARFAELRTQRDKLEAELAPTRARVDKIAAEEALLRERRRALRPTIEANMAKMGPIDKELAQISRALGGKTGVVPS